jgi:hypothetical protein
VLCRADDVVKEYRQSLMLCLPWNSARRAPLGCPLDRVLSNITRFKSKVAPPTNFSGESLPSLNDEIWRLHLDVLAPKRAAQVSVADPKLSPVETFSSLG